MNYRNQIITGDCLTVLQSLPDNIVQTVVTSPPYYGLRDYGVAEQIGLEDTPEQYITKLVDVFRKVRRVLRQDGTLWLNSGDSYAGGSRGRDDSGDNGKFAGPRIERKDNPIPAGYKPKDLMMIPARMAIALQEDGWYLRSDIIWHKPTAMPESVLDRPTSAHEHIFLLAKSERYFYDAESIKESSSSDHPSGNGFKREARLSYLNADGTARGNEQQWQLTPTRNKRNVWTVNTQPYNEAHFATFPPKLIEPCILAGTSPKTCEHCGTAWKRVIIPTGHINKREAAHTPNSCPTKTDSTGWAHTHVATDKWEPTCSCNNNTGGGKCIVLDPFMGAGTVALVAIQHGRDYLGIELNPEYVKLIDKRIDTVQQNLWSVAEGEVVA